MKLVGGDSGRVEYEEFVEQFVLAPSERVVVDAPVESPGELALEHHTLDRTYRLAAITVTEGAPRPPPPSSGSCAGPQNWRPSVPSWTAGWPRPGQDPGTGRADGRPSCYAGRRRAGHLCLSDASRCH